MSIEENSEEVAEQINGMTEAEKNRIAVDRLRKKGVKPFDRSGGATFALSKEMERLDAETDTLDTPVIPEEAAEAYFRVSKGDSR